MYFRVKALDSMPHMAKKKTDRLQGQTDLSPSPNTGIHSLHGLLHVMYTKHFVCKWNERLAHKAVAHIGRGNAGHVEKSSETPEPTEAQQSPET